MESQCLVLRVTLYHDTNINIVELTHAHPMKYEDYHYILQNTWNYRFPLINYSSHHMVICTNGIRDPGGDEAKFDVK